MTERYQFNSNDRALLDAAIALLKKVIVAEVLRPAELVSVAKLLHVLTVLPKVTSGLEVTVSVTSPRRNFDEIETYHWWDVGVEGERLSIRSSGHFYRPSTGGDTFITTDWAAIPGEPAESNDYRASLRMVPDVQSFPEAVGSIDFKSRSFTVEITDQDNPLLEGNDEPGDEDTDEEGDSEPEGEDDMAELDGDTPAAWSVTPIDAVEARLASAINADEVEANDPGHAYCIENCHLCGCALDQRGMFVDGWLRDHRETANMCALCFAASGKGLGWGVGQLYARQPEGGWRMVAGFRGRS
jgi:hypothetical protein